MVNAEARAVLAAKFEVIFPQLDERQRWSLMILGRDPQQVVADTP